MATPTQNARRTLKAKTQPRRLAACVRAAATGKRCIAKTKSGEPCLAAPLHGKKRCAFHSGDTARVLGAKGGRRRAIFNPDGLEPMAAPKDPAELLLLISQTIVEVRSAKIDTRAANSIAYLGASFLRAAEVANLESRLKALEDRQSAYEKAKALR